MDAFWGITLSVIVVSSYLKRRKIKTEDRRYDERKATEKTERQKQQDVIDKYTHIFAGPLTAEEKAEIKAEKEREKEIEQLRKQGYTDELIAVILPTINNGQ
jgi:biopolymer transport protein ExbB/TolQ